MASLSQAQAKRRMCEQLDIACMWEDRSDFIAEISKATRCVLIQPRA